MNTLLVDSVPRTRILINTGKLTTPTRKLRIFSKKKNLSCPLNLLSNYERKQCAWDIVIMIYY
jgi:hypothetical protein